MFLERFLRGTAARWMARRIAAGLSAGILVVGTIGPSAASDGDTLTIVVVGDVGLNPGRATVDPRGVFKGKFQPWDDTLPLIRGDIDGDLNFMNLETVVTDRNDLTADTKGQTRPYNFRTHPNGVRYLVSQGFNLVSLANNHSMDFGVDGLQETLRHVGALRGAGLKAAAGIGMNREQASRPQAFVVNGAPVAFAAMGIVTNNLERHRAGPDKPGQIAYRFDDDFAEVLRRLTATPAAYRILSIHYGYERDVRADALQLKQWRGEAGLRDGVDLVVGHHAHVVRGVEIAGRSLVFYGLGNFLHHGTADMTRNDICRNYGLMARVHLRKGADGHYLLRAVEAIPVTDTHYRPRRLPPDEAAMRLHALNYLAETLDDPNGRARGVRFTPKPDGSGIYCLPGAEGEPGRVGAVCRGFTPPPPIPAGLRGAIAASCKD